MLAANYLDQCSRELTSYNSVVKRWTPIKLTNSVVRRWTPS